MVLSILSRGAVLFLLFFLAMLTEYNNLKISYNNARLVELSSGKMMRWFYEFSDNFFAMFGEPEKVAATSGGMTWSIRIMGVPFTDPIAALSVLIKNFELEAGFALGLTLPLLLSFLFGRVFCSYICPASLQFFFISRVRRWLSPYLYMPQVKLNRGFAWGVLFGGLLTALLFGHGIWTLLLPYFAVGQTIFQGMAFGLLTISIFTIIFYSLVDLFLGQQFTCRYVCPTGRLLGFLGRKALVSIRRDKESCVSSCTSCEVVCPMGISPKLDQTVDCSLCGECMTICPTNCLEIGTRN